MDAGQLRLVGLTLLLPEQAKVKARQNFQTSICKINIEKKGNKKVETVLKKFHLKDNIIGFHTQTQKLELQTK